MQKIKSKYADKQVLIIVLIIVAFLFQITKLTAQTSTIKKVSRPEICWAIWHPFKVRIAQQITAQTLNITDSIKNSNTLDGDILGGQLDAFKHSLWMASLSKKMHWRKAWKLGKAHEKGNYLSYKKGKRKGKKKLPDKLSSDMDFYNNRKGIEIGLAYKTSIQNEIIQIILDSIQAGKFMIIKKNQKGQFLDINDQIILTDTLEEKWETQKTLVPSNCKFNK